MTTKELIMQGLTAFLAKCKEVFVNVNNVVNNCASTSTTMPLSANQGKVLQDKITSINTKLTDFLVVERYVQDSVTIPGGSFKNVTYDVPSKTGYTCLETCGIYVANADGGSGSGSCFLIANHKGAYRIGNIGIADAQIKVTIYLLYMKN